MKYLLALLICLCSPAFAQKQEIAPEFVDIAGWINSDPIELQTLRGQADVMVYFWTYSCINCIDTLPHLNHWYDEYRDKNLKIIGVHTPEYLFEQSKDSLQEAINRYGVRFPVAMDNAYATWTAYHNRYWPTYYLIDKQGNITNKFIGEGNYREIDNAIRKLLNLARLEDNKEPKITTHITPEIYLGAQRAKAYKTGTELKANSIKSYTSNTPLSEDQAALKGLFRVTKESVTAAGNNCKIEINFQASRVYLLLSGSSPDPVTVLLDGKPLAEHNYSLDMDSDGQIFLDGDRLYSLLDLHGIPSRHILTVRIPAGISAYAFNFKAA